MVASISDWFDPISDCKACHRMIRISKRVEYGLVALRHVSRQRGRLISAKELAQTYGLSQALTAKILQALTQAEILESVQGTKGGYRLKQDLRSVSYLELQSAILGDVPGESDTSRHESCDLYHRCVVLEPVVSLERRVRSLLESTTVAELLSESVPSSCCQTTSDTLETKEKIESMEHIDT